MAWTQLVISLALVGCSFAILSKRSYDDDQKQYEYQTIQTTNFPLAQIIGAVSNAFNAMGERLTRNPQQFDHGHHGHPGYGYRHPPGFGPPPPPPHHHHHHHHPPPPPHHQGFQQQFDGEVFIPHPWNPFMFRNPFLPKAPGFPKLPEFPKLPTLPQLPMLPQQIGGFQQNFPKLPGFPPFQGHVNPQQGGFPNNPFINNMFNGQQPQPQQPQVNPQLQPQTQPQQPQQPQQPEPNQPNPTDDLISNIFGGPQGSTTSTPRTQPIQPTAEPKGNDLIHSVFPGLNPNGTPTTAPPPTQPPSPQPKEQSMDELIQSIFSNMDDKIPNTGTTPVPPSKDSELIYDIDVRSS